VLKGGTIMMVTFVAECEKKSLPKTRRVLDAFANRIGSRTWQTVITNEGLQAVKKLLRKTASKNTAVSCHWNRSRSRSELVWIVGNRKKFNHAGVVPVNYTNNKIMIGEVEIMIDEFYANTKNQRLDQHSFAVGYLAQAIVKRQIPNNPNLEKSVFVAGCWHDIGKIDPQFQEWLNRKLNNNDNEEVPDDGQHIEKGKFSWEKHPRHNEISLLLFHLLFNKNEINSDSYERAKHAIFWHHTKPLRKNEIKNLVGIFDKLEDFEKNYVKWTSSISAIFQAVNQIANEYSEEYHFDISSLEIPKFESIEDDLEQAPLPCYKRYSEKEALEKYQKNIQYNALNNIARTALITADRLVSQLTGDVLSEHLNNGSLESILDNAFHKDRGLKQQIQECLDGFNQDNPEIERNKQQAIVANNLADEEVTIGVLKGPAGCGKTKIALEWAMMTDVKKLFWVCPRVQICEGLFKDLQAAEYLPNTKLEICTGENKHILTEGKSLETQEGEEFSGDIVITTIDQIVNSITTHRKVETLVSFMDAHVVFDEYHEYINMPAFNLLFAELVDCKKRQQIEDETLPNTLLVSATPNPLFVQDFLGINTGDIEGIKSFNESRYKIDFVEYDDNNEDDSNPLFQTQPDNTIVISNTAITAQKSFIANQEKEDAILLHSKFTTGDRAEIFKNAFKENGNRKYDVLRSGPIIQASLNITCDKMVSEMTHPENSLQRLGRLDRFGQNEQVNIFVIAITEGVKNGTSIDSSSRFLHALDSLKSAKAWLHFLQNELSEKPLKIKQIYELYDRFYNDNNCRLLVEQDLISSLKKSVGRIASKLIDPVTFPRNANEKNKIKIKKHSLRGDSRFVQMAVCKANSRDDFKPINEYAYPESESEKSLTYSVDVICGHGIADKNLLAVMAKKHHNIKQTKKAYNDNQLLNEARNPDTPIYLSYTPEDLKRVEAQPEPFAVYYAQGHNQPIGAISVNHLKGDNNEE